MSVYARVNRRNIVGDRLVFETVSQSLYEAGELSRFSNDCQIARSNQV